MTHSPHTTLRRLLHRVPPWARPSLAVIAAGIVAAPLVYAVAVWQARSERVTEPAMAAAIARVMQGGIGSVSLPYGNMTMGLGTTPGTVETDPESRKFFWQLVDGLPPKACTEVATGFLGQSGLIALQIGSVSIPLPGLSQQRKANAVTIADTCHEAEQNTLSVVLTFGEYL